MSDLIYNTDGLWIMVQSGIDSTWQLWVLFALAEKAGQQKP